MRSIVIATTLVLLSSLAWAQQQAPTTNTTGETVLSNMKAKTDAQWAGDIYSRASGNTYYAKMTFKQPDTLRVEACAIGRFFCSGNDWTRVPRSDEMVTSRNLPASPKS